MKTFAQLDCYRDDEAQTGDRPKSMQLVGRQVSKWWLLLLLPLLLVASPLILMLFFAGNNLAGAIVGPPAIWNRPFHTPFHRDLVGKYEESTRHTDHQMNRSKAILQLNADDSMSVTALPYEAGQTTCVLSGGGRWKGPDQNSQIDLIYESDGTLGSCISGAYSPVEITGRSRPYGLYWIIGDPDSGTGVWLKTTK